MEEGRCHVEIRTSMGGGASSVRSMRTEAAAATMWVSGGAHAANVRGMHEPSAQRREVGAQPRLHAPRSTAARVWQLPSTHS